MRDKVLEFLEMIITETGMSTDPEALASHICAEAVKLRDGLEESGRRTVYPLVLARGQTLDVSINPDGTVHNVRELMPPLLNFSRLPEPTPAGEKAAREAEWRAAEAQRWARPNALRGDPASVGAGRDVDR